MVEEREIKIHTRNRSLKESRELTAYVKREGGLRRWKGVKEGRGDCVDVRVVEKPDEKSGKINVPLLARVYIYVRMC